MFRNVRRVDPAEWPRLRHYHRLRNAVRDEDSGRTLHAPPDACSPIVLGGHGDALKPGSPRRLPPFTTKAKLRRAPSSDVA
jgi:hypothetical protein